MRTLRSGKPIVKTTHLEKFSQLYFYFICAPAALWGFGTLLDDKSSFIAFWWVVAIGLSGILFYGHYIEATKQDPNEFGKPGHDEWGRPLVHGRVASIDSRKPDDLLAMQQRKKLTHTEWAWRDTYPFTGNCLWI